MAEINFGEPQNGIATQTTGNPNIEEAPKDTNIQPEDEQTENTSSEEPGVTEETHHTSETIYSLEEQKDPNKIHVKIADQETPIVVFFGPPACGKTMNSYLSCPLSERTWLHRNPCNLIPTIARQKLSGHVPLF